MQLVSASWMVSSSPWGSWVRRCAVVAAIGASALSTSALAQLTVTAIDPPITSSNRAPNTSIVVDFDRALDPTTTGNFGVYGNFTGPLTGVLALENGNTRLRFTPTRSLFAGETVMIGMSHDLRAADGSFLRAAGYVSTFRVQSLPAPMTFTSLGSFYTEPGTFTRIYGGQTCDLDGDDYVDLAVVSEVTSDVRVFKNRADASGLFVTPNFSVTPVATEPSPNENADMNRDGKLDIVTCNGAADSVSVLIGNGDGSFQPAVNYTVGTTPHGLALLDCDGDGDMDVVTANTSSDNLCLRKNDGTGVLLAPTFFEGGGSGEYALTAADMDNDGITDLVVGLRFSQLVVVHKGNGNGTFTPQPAQNAGGGVWMIVCGDVNADGKMDVSSANSFSNSGSILLGNGNGTLQAAQVVAGLGHMPATDLGDLDGDGDLDWVLSSFGAQEWRMYRNDAGTFHYVTSFPSSANPACAAIFDFDNDRDLDLVLFTETSDEIVVQENGALDALTFCYGTLVSCPCGNSGVKGHGCESSAATGGALLNATGRASVASDSVSLVATGLPFTSPTVLFQGTTEINGGLGAVFGDGLRCAGGSTVRLVVRSAVNGYVSYGSGTVGDTPIHLAGAIPVAGATRAYQAWYRDSAAFCTAGTFNLSNGVRLVWTP